MNGLKRTLTVAAGLLVALTLGGCDPDPCVRNPNAADCSPPPPPPPTPAAASANAERTDPIHLTSFTRRMEMP